jgi:putative phosphoesterase
MGIMGIGKGILPNSHAVPTFLGILSDSHGRRERVRTAIRLLTEAGAERFVHLGDLEDASALDDLAGLPFAIVFCNCDDERDLGRTAECLGIECVHPGGILEVGSKRVAITHGHLEGELRRLRSLDPDYLLHGHTHERRDRIEHGIRTINPGALHRAVPHTVALLEVESGRLETIPLPDGSPFRIDRRPG